MNVEELLEINFGLKRRLMSRYLPATKKIKLYDAKLRIVKSDFCGVDLINPIVLEPERLSDSTRCFTASFPLKGKEFFSHDEIRLILGEDYFTATNDEDLVTMLDAVQGGAYGSNAYFLGGSFHQSGVVHVPVAYFKIHENTRRSLAINSKDKRFKYLIERLKNSP